MKRKQVTLPRVDFYDKYKALSANIKMSVCDAIFELLFDGTEPDYQNFSENERTALALIIPNLRRVQSQYDNGKSEKKSTQKLKGLFCPVEPSQIQPNQANASQTASILNNNIFNNIYSNKQTIQTIKTESPDGRIIKSEIKFDLTPKNKKATNWYVEQLEEHIQELEDRNITIYNRFLNLIHTIAEEPEPLKIRNQFIAPDGILEQYLNIFRCEIDTAESRLVEIFNVVDQKAENKTTPISNKYKYLVSVMYIIASDF